MKCPSCGTDAGSAKFCPDCGTALAERTCNACGAKLSARSKFCPDCGKAVGPAQAVSAPASASSFLPWLIAGVAVVALATTIIIAVTRRPGPAAAPGAAPFAGGQTGPAPDISNMTPREQADRLFNRVMESSTTGDTARVGFFGPMAINAYANISPLDADARLHLGMIHLTLGDAASALAQADSIQREAPEHLFGPLLAARAAEAAGTDARRRTAYAALLARWDAERAKNLTEYQQHDADLQAARSTAQSLR
jgi:hypothetical protein